MPFIERMAKNADERDADSIADYLTITTGKEWKVQSAYGYCQGDYAEIVYCPERYKDGVKEYGDVFSDVQRNLLLLT